MTTPNTPLPRKRRRSNSEHKLLEAGLKLASEGGYEHITIMAVADLAGVSRVTAYKYFRNKDHLLAALASHWSEEALEALHHAGIQDKDLPRLAARRLGFVVRFFRSQPLLLSAVLSAMASAEGQHLLRDVHVVARYMGVDLTHYGPERQVMLSRIFGYTLQAVLASAHAERIAADVVQQDLEFLCERLLRED